MPPPKIELVEDAFKRVGKLRVLTQDDSDKVFLPAPAQVKQSSVEFQAVAAVINLALSILTTEKSKLAIGKIGLAMLYKRGDSGHVFKGSTKYLPLWVNYFIAYVRAQFPPVILTNRIKNEAELHRSSWAKRSTNMLDWRPNNAAVLYMNKTVIQNMLQAAKNSCKNPKKDSQEQTTYENLIFLMAISVAHEMVHLWIGFLTGFTEPGTPSKICFPPLDQAQPEFEDNEGGEAGRAWEGEVLGGTIKAMQSESNPLGNRQSGNLYIIDAKSIARRIDKDCIRSAVRYNYEFPLETDTAPVPWTDLKRSRRSMQEVRFFILSKHLVNAIESKALGKTVTASELKEYKKKAGHTVQGREFEALRRLPSRPRRLYIKVV